MRLLKITLVLAVTVVTFFTACKKKNETEYNKIIIAGNSNAALNREIIPDECLIFPESVIHCIPDMYKTMLVLAFPAGERMYIEITRSVSSTEIPLGTFPFAGQCQIGNISYFYFDEARKSAGLYFSSGRIDIVQSGDVYDVDIDMDIDGVSGGGTIRGNFHGSIEPGDTGNE